MGLAGKGSDRLTKRPGKGMTYCPTERRNHASSSIPGGKEKGTMKPVSNDLSKGYGGCPPTATLDR